MIKQTVEVPAWQLLVVMSTYGGLLMILLTGLFWTWSGMASLGTFYLILGAPFLVLFTAISTVRQQNSLYHRWIFRASAAYLPLIVGLILVAALSQ
ncbi:hypothetical protein DNI29_12450 [Hymenobacter sediminis]|uniref:hypothetical protein n=1 Tax=Hymenobacter sediminis TaxID=2218621 RepID=UPI000F4F275F|nr:hypothetical protein [Hymenobacter sediminis]RPD46964.1 hypothetical protein DNI29_12450 [Hymenobacter sediminis]